MNETITSSQPVLASTAAPHLAYPEDSIFLDPSVPIVGGGAILRRPPSLEKEYPKTTLLISSTAWQKVLCSAEFAYPDNQKRVDLMSPLHLSLDEEASPGQVW